MDLLYFQTECEYLSDLRFLTEQRHQHLANILEHLTPYEESLRDWNDALEYLAGAAPEQTAEAAKIKLMKHLRIGTNCYFTLVGENEQEI